MSSNAVRASKNSYGITFEIDGPITIPSGRGVRFYSIWQNSVEFFDMMGNTVAEITLPASAVRVPTPADRPAVRALTA